MPGSTLRLRVVVTGYGAISALGQDAASHREVVRMAISGLRTITRFDASRFPTTFAAEIDGFDPIGRLGPELAANSDRVTQLAVAATREALAHLGIDSRLNGSRTAVLIGSAFGGIESLAAATSSLIASGPAAFRGLGLTRWSIAAPGTMVARDIGATGPVFSPAAAFASSANAIGEGTRMIREGRADLVIAGGAEAPICAPILAGFAAMQSLSTVNHAPATAVKPFDLHRDGCAIGEGAAVLVLERMDHAHHRGAQVIAEIAGYGATADAFHDVQLTPDAAGLAEAMRLAIAESGLTPIDIDYLNAHGTGTTMNDAYETAAIRAFFESAAESLAISSTKSRTGHLLGAAGALEAVIAIQALEDGVVPSTLYLVTPDPICNLDYIPGAPRERVLKAVMSNSMGFGGHNVSLVFALPGGR
jgi:3-oxoacyl-[acyl-carrier-protein] synthase II